MVQYFPSDYYNYFDISDNLDVHYQDMLEKDLDNTSDVIMI